jgi:uroporphyrinogen-III decarboxylase
MRLPSPIPDIAGVFAGRPQERLPRAIFGGGLWAFAQAGLLPGELAGDPGRFVSALSALYDGLDTDMIFVGSGLNSFPAESIGGILRFDGRGAPLLERPLISSTADLLRAEASDPLDSPSTAALVRVVEGVRANLPNRFLCATSWGPFTWGMILCDPELLREKLTADPPFIGAIAALGARLSVAYFDQLIDRGLIDGVSVPDGAVTFLPDEAYRDLVLPRQRELFDHVRGRGIRTILHMCGRIRHQLPLYPGAGADCISIDSSVGVGEAYELYRGSTVTAGNVDAVAVLAHGDEAAVRAAVAACIRQVGDPRLRYILMPSCDLPVDTPPLNVAAFLAAADER